MRTSQFKHVLKLLARKRLGTRWSKYPFSRCRVPVLVRRSRAVAIRKFCEPGFVDSCVIIMEVLRIKVTIVWKLSCLLNFNVEIRIHNTANLRTTILDFRGSDSSRILMLRGGILMAMWNSPEGLSQRTPNLSREIPSREIGRTCKRCPSPASRRTSSPPPSCGCPTRRRRCPGPGKNRVIAFDVMLRLSDG